MNVDVKVTDLRLANNQLTAVCDVCPVGSDPVTGVVVRLPLSAVWGTVERAISDAVRPLFTQTVEHLNCPLP